MNIYAVIPAVIPAAAIIAYIPLLFTTLGSRPWQKKHKLFILFLIAAMAWSLADYIFRSNFFPQHNFLFLKITLIMFTGMAVQFHCFTSSFFSPGQGRWLPLAYGLLVLIIALVVLGHFPEGLEISGDKLYPMYGKSVVYLAVPLLTLVARNVYVFWKRLKILDNPVIYSQTVSLLVAVFVLTLFGLAAILPWGREFPITHFGSIINAFILSYATISHQLVDIRFVLRRGLAWISLAIIGGASYGLLLTILHVVLRLQLDLGTILAATGVALLVIASLYKLRGSFFATIGKAFQGQTYDYRQKLSNFANRIHSVFSLKEQGGELLTLVTKAVGCEGACLLFPEVGGGDFTAQLVEPKGKDNPLSGLKLGGRSPIVEHLVQKQRLLTREDLAILPEFRGLWKQEREAIKSNGIELFVPLISRERLIGILVLGRRQSGRYSLEDFNLLEDVANRVAVSMEKEYLREQLREREEELLVINRSSAIITSSLDIQRIYDSFIKELKKVVEVSWAAIVLIEGDDLHFLALSSEIGSAWQVGERIPINGTAIEWIATHRKTVVESDLSQEGRFATKEYHRRQGVRSIAYLPLIAKGKVIGSLIVASRQPQAYSQRHIMLLEQLASQIAMPVENSRLYAEAEGKARVDELTGLLNRRCLDETIASEIGRHSRYGNVFSLIVLDLDSFKAFNDHYGHLAGDKLLRRIGSIMKGSIRSADQAFRYGGDEFAVLLPQTDIEATYEVAERIRQRVALEGEAGYVPITASLGLASWPTNGISSNEVVAAADAALYSAKRSGGNQSHCTSTMLPPADDTLVGAGSNGGSGVLSTMYALAATVDARDHYTRSHSKRVSEYAVALAEALNVEPMKIRGLQTCALLHDIGKIGISDDILNKQGKLTPEEWEIIKGHSQLGATITGHARQLAPCIAGIRHHHERYDGTGYPHGLKGEAIPLEARVLAIADAFAAMTSNRPYCEALSGEEALEEIKRGAGKQFDPNLAVVFLSIVKTTPSLAREG